MPRAFTLPITSSLLTNDFASAVQEKDPRQYVMIDAACGITDTGCTGALPGQLRAGHHHFLQKQRGVD